ncbi:NADP-dependent oxidoreductase [Alkalilimnicola ehrlichii]|uniref:NADP-dependent oxidoreductase n=1 Tax=Alkalilimnicola ehrlichii TaxID=351052 RepID=A0A3E0WIB7_9GAMM|nr:NADP-dependent oxidoreductase [Alkalilimnicola ehrlichii]RFA26187.1 NADP-dependent oxidoreductase [Alkalilimnicola ehrlichii]RFA31706.1 NADP-dependent oxidoreductase [Alkalilimnicola ehrlichii]
MSEQNTQVKLIKRPVGEVQNSDFEVGQAPIPEPRDGEVLIKVHSLSLDPAMRGWMNEGKSYVPPVGIGEVMRALGAGQVIRSRDAKFKEGDWVSGIVGVQEYAAVPAKELTPIDPSLAPVAKYLGVLGMPGMTAYFGLLEVGQPKEGETVVISGAAGAVGQVVGQVAKLKGCKVVGIAGGPEKCRFLTEELGFDGAIDYKAEDVKAGLKRTCPDGVDVFFDNVGGDILDAVLTRLRMHARIAICGAISQYNNTTPVKGPSNYMSLLVNRARMQGLVVFDYRHQYAAAAQEMAGWMAQGKLKSKEHIVRGIEQFPEHLMMLFRGENFGKLVLQVAED